MATDKRALTGPLSKGPQADPFDFQAPAAPPAKAEEEPASLLDTAKEAGTSLGEIKEGAQETKENVDRLRGKLEGLGTQATEELGKLDKLKDAGGKLLGGVAIAQGLQEAVKALSGNPMDPGKAIDALSEVAESAGELLSKDPLAKIAGVAGGALLAVQGMKDLISQFKEASAKEGGMTPSDMLGMAASAFQTIGGVASAIAPFTGPAAAPLAAVAGACYAASAAANVAKLAVDNWDGIKEAATKAWNDPVGSAKEVAALGAKAVADAQATVRDAVSSAWGWLTGSTPSPAPA